MGLVGVNTATFGWGAYPQPVGFQKVTQAPLATVAFGRDAFIATQAKRATPVKFGYDPFLGVGVALAVVGFVVSAVNLLGSRSQDNE